MSVCVTVCVLVCRCDVKHPLLRILETSGNHNFFVFVLWYVRFWDLDLPLLPREGNFVMVLSVIDRWQVTCDMWNLTQDMWHLTHDMWLGTHDTWHMIFSSFCSSEPTKTEIAKKCFTLKLLRDRSKFKIKFSSPLFSKLQNFWQML